MEIRVRSATWVEVWLPTILVLAFVIVSALVAIWLSAILVPVAIFSLIASKRAWRDHDVELLADDVGFSKLRSGQVEWTLPWVKIGSYRVVPGFPTQSLELLDTITDVRLRVRLSSDYSSLDQVAARAEMFAALKSRANKPSAAVLYRGEM